MPTNIQWTDETVNFWMGCKKVSAGCKLCYMYRDMDRYGKNGSVVVPVQEKTNLNKLRKLAPGSKIFTCSWSDFFIEEADPWRARAWDIIRAHPQFIWQILTKRPERIKQCLPDDWGDGYPNVWLGVSVENQEAADERIPILIDIPAVVRFLSCEPLLEFVDLFNYGQNKWYKSIHWVIVGGESGNDVGKYTYRPCDLNWIKDIVFNCERYNVPVFVKQLGTHLSKELHLKDRHAGVVGEFPFSLRVLQFPIMQDQVNDPW